MNALPVILITGPVGVGKTTVAFGVSLLLENAGMAHALIDLDAFSWCYPRPPGDSFHQAFALKNLATVWPNYAVAGADRLVLARALESRAALDGYRGALPDAEITVVRLRPSDATLKALGPVGRFGVGS